MGETDTIYFHDWNLHLTLSPLGMLFYGFIVFALIKGAIDLHTEKQRLKAANTDLYGLIAERNAEIHRLTNDLEDEDHS